LTFGQNRKRGYARAEALRGLGVSYRINHKHGKAESERWCRRPARVSGGTPCLAATAAAAPDRGSGSIAARQAAGSVSRPKDGLKLHNALAFAIAFAVL